MKLAIIGAGKMGWWFTKFFLEKDISVTVSDTNKEALSKIERELGVQTADNVEAVKGANMVLVCVKAEDLEAVIEEIRPHVRPGQAILDICTYKTFPTRILHKHIRSGITLGMHPMFGPDAKSVRNQNFILTPTNPEEEAFARKLKAWLEGNRARAVIMSPEKHDKLVARAKSLPHFIRYYFIGPVDRRFPQLRGFHYWIASLT